MIPAGHLRVAAAAITLLAAIWCLATVSPVLLEAGGRSDGARLIRWVFDPLCHQIPERAFSPGGVPLAVCARCTGVYAGFLAGCLIVLAAARRLALSPFPRRRWILLAAVPGLLEWTSSRAGVIPDMAPARALTGAVFGLVVAFYFVPAMVQMGRELGRERRRLLTSKRMEHAESS